MRARRLPGTRTMLALCMTGLAPAVRHASATRPSQEPAGPIEKAARVDERRNGRPRSAAADCLSLRREGGNRSDRPNPGKDLARVELEEPALVCTDLVHADVI